jgi:hypothetical protein
MNVSEIRQTDGLTRSGIVLVVILFFCLLLGGFLIGTDLYDYNDFDSAMTVLVIFSLMGVFAALFLLGKRNGLVGLIAVSGFLLVSQIIYVIAFLTQTTIDPSWHDPVANWFVTVLYVLFTLLTLVFSIKVYREN